ncbi:rCG61950 [Rattus norvegicus]|uniref:RCG61950 n=1 Tax=Rattus norvegicus TaxID=10116 RepID=A6HC87_RAT|nr:rCG61950 [Rattus norvegicus]
MEIEVSLWWHIGSWGFV